MKPYQMLAICLIAPGVIIGLYMFFWVMAMPIGADHWSIWQPWLAFGELLFFMLVGGVVLFNKEKLL